MNSTSILITTGLILTLVMEQTILFHSFFFLRLLDILIALQYTSIASLKSLVDMKAKHIWQLKRKKEQKSIIILLFIVTHRKMFFSFTSGLLKDTEKDKEQSLKKTVFLHSSLKGLMIEKYFPRKAKCSPSSPKRRTKGRDQKKFYKRYYL